MATDPKEIFNSFFSAGSWDEPPDGVVLRILGLEERPTDHVAIHGAFRAQLFRFHPDTRNYTVPCVEQLADALLGTVPDVQELVWARDVLLRKVPQPVTDAGSTTRDVKSRNSACPVCGDGDRRSVRHGRWQGYCWDCARSAENERQRDRRRDARADQVCAECAKSFTPPRSDGRYCSGACRQAAYRSRRGVMA